jgi:hypothetical protein
VRIKYTEFAPDPRQWNTVVNLPAHVAQVLIATNQAVAVPWKDFRERLAATATAGADPFNVNAYVEGVQWGVIPAETSQFRRVVICKRAGAETTWYDGPTSEMPPSIVAQFEQLTNSTVDPEVLAERREQDKNRQILQEQQERKAAYKYLRT